MEMFLVNLLCLFSLVGFVNGLIHPIEITDKHFYDSVTGQPFFIKGVDYQPGGSSEVDGEKDPLSDPQVCARDIILFQELGINTVRIYSINPSLNHDTCVTMLAIAGIYLLLDVNSPLVNQHLNRYEPWTTYNSNYLEHVFKVVQEFSGYNNTLGFFAGNEVINDKKSAYNSPVYVKQLITDMKSYIKKNCKRNIPVGYSAADDLSYRVPLSKYLECESNENSKMMSVDFYGVNSYQWCGKQTIKSSGYDELISAYKDYSKPVFFSEYGCNKVLPRQFGETETLYSKDMANTFCGGLVYEFTQESNNYGLVKLSDDGDVQILNDFKQLQQTYNAVIDISINNGESKKDKPPTCETQYSNINIDTDVPKTLAKSLIEKGVGSEGKYEDLEADDLETKYNIYDSDGTPWLLRNKIRVVNSLTTESDDTKNDPYKEEAHQNKKNSSKTLRYSSFNTIAATVFVIFLLQL